VDRLSELFGGQVQFTYTAWDRIVLNGYLDGLHRPEQVIAFFHDVAGIACITPEVLASRTARYRQWVEHSVAAEHIPLLAAPKGVRKEEVVRPYYRRLEGAEGIACVLTSLEQGRTFVSYTPRAAVASRDPNYRRISVSPNQRFLHYYFYVLDPVMGPMSLRVGTYLPFTVRCYLNGHSFLAQELTRAGVAFRKEENAFLAVADPVALQAAADRLTPQVLEQRCRFWTERLAPHFPPKEQVAFPLRYRYSVAQIELATDVLFRQATPLRALFRRAAELGVMLGGADRTTYLFGRRVTRRYRGRLETVLEHQEAGHPTLRAYYQTSFVKQYEKSERLLRTETCLNDTHHLALGRRLEHLPEVRERLAATNARYLEAQAELLASTVDTGQVAALAQPTVVGKRRVPGLKLHDDRVIRVLDTLLHPGGFLADWTTRDRSTRLLARQRLTDAEYRLSQLRYDLTKLRAKGLVERLGTSRRYRLTTLGVQLGVLLVKLHTRLLGPLGSLAAQTPSRPPTRNQSDVEAAFRQVDTALNHLWDTLGLKPAA
jgi:hypothetical protein